MSDVYCFTAVLASMSGGKVYPINQQCFSKLQDGLFYLRANLYIDWLCENVERGRNLPDTDKMLKRWMNNRADILVYPKKQPKGNKEAWETILRGVTECVECLSYEDIFGGEVEWNEVYFLNKLVLR